MGRPWWYDSYWQKKQKQHRFRLPNRKILMWSALILLSLLLAVASTGFQPNITDWILGFISYFCRILALCVFIRVMLSWFRFGIYNWPIIFLYDLTSPILEPLRRIIPTLKGFDLSPMIAILILYFFPFIISRFIALLV